VRGRVRCTTARPAPRARPVGHLSTPGLPKRPTSLPARGRSVSRARHGCSTDHLVARRQRIGHLCASALPQSPPRRPGATASRSVLPARPRCPEGPTSSAPSWTRAPCGHTTSRRPPMSAAGRGAGDGSILVPAAARFHIGFCFTGRAGSITPRIPARAVRNDSRFRSNSAPPSAAAPPPAPARPSPAPRAAAPGAARAL
jgi:hypothetical protein